MPPKKTAVKRPYKKRAYKKKNPGTKLVTKSQLYKAIHKNEETKLVLTEAAYTLYNSGISSASEMVSIIPPMSQGTSGNQRVGDSIRPIKLVFRAVLSYNADNISSANMIISRLFLLQQKGIRDAGYAASLSTQILQNGSVGTTFTGALLDITRPKNTDLFTFYADKKHKFLKPAGLSYTGVASGITSMDKSMVQFVTITLTQKQLPAVLKYNGTSATSPDNFLPLMALGYAYAQNDTPDGISTQLGISWTSTLYYKDA